MQHLRRLSPRFGVIFTARGRAQEQIDRLGEGVVLGEGGSRAAGFSLGVRADEAVAVARDGADETRLTRVVSQGAPQDSHGLGERALGDDHVAPHRIEDLAAVHRLGPPLHQQHEQVEVAGNERELLGPAQEHAPRGRQGELAESVFRKGLWRNRGHEETSL